MSDIPLLPITEAAGSLAAALLREAALPPKAVNDALHVAVAAIHGIDYLLTWNYRHLDNAETKPAIRDTCVRHWHRKMSDDVTEELWRIKDDMAREYRYDVARLAAALQAKQADQGHRVVDLQTLRAAAEPGDPPRTAP